MSTSGGTKSSTKFKPVRMRCGRLKIGEWAFTVPPASHPATFEVKFLFSRKRLVWEWKIDSVTKRKVEVGFATIEQMYANDISPNLTKMLVVVKAPPNLYLGTIANNQPTKWALCEDFTNGNYEKSSLHELDLAVDGKTMNSVLQTMSDYAENFQTMLAQRLQNGNNRVPMIAHEEPPTKRFRSSDKAISVQRPQTSGCACVGHCDAFTCPCSVSLAPCNPLTCKCTRNSCQNPLSLLSAKGISLDGLKRHPCLNDNLNLHPERNPRKLLLSRIRLPCCKVETALIHALAVNARCFCGNQWNYSFCRQTLIKSNAPSCFHCPKCKSCQNVDAKHCDQCGVCSSPSNPCPCSMVKKPAPRQLPASAVAMFEDDRPPLVSPSDRLSTDSPASAASLQPPDDAEPRTSGTSLYDLSAWSWAFLGLGRLPNFYEELQMMVQDLYR